MTWFASPWDEKSVDFLEEFEPVCYKIASASLTDTVLLERLNETGRPLILSTGMSTLEEIKSAVELLGTDNLMVTHTTSAYPCEPDELNLNMIKTLREMFPVPVGYSGHESGAFCCGGFTGRMPGGTPYHPRPCALGQRSGCLS